jgi:galactokinase
MYKADHLKHLILNGSFDGDFIYLYQEEPEKQKTRYCAEIDRFVALFGPNRDLFLFSAPGRSELSGNHTDHQHGRVLAATVTLDTIAVVSPRPDTLVRIHSQGFHPFSSDLADLNKIEAEIGTSAALVRGIAADLTRLGYAICGFDACITSSIPAGSGLSSSAAFETLIGTIWNHLCNQARIPPLQIAQTGWFAENVYFGKPCGLMDQTASAVGNIVTMDFADPDRPFVEQINCNFSVMGYTLYVVDAGRSHADLTDEYAAIPREMGEVAAYFGKKVLRDVDPQLFQVSLPALREKVSDRAILRAMHFFAENQRVGLQTDALRQQDITEYLILMQASGDSSAMKLQNIYPLDNILDRSIPLALAICRQHLVGRGAWRVHGGGFAGTVQALVPNDLTCRFESAIEAVFGQGSCIRLVVRPAGGVILKADSEE